MTQPIIIFEGMPRVGKTTLSNQLKDTFGYGLIPEIHPDIRELFNMREVQDQNVFMLNDRLKIALACSSNHKLTVMDRGGISTLAYHTHKDRSMGDNPWMATIENEFNDKWLPLYQLDNVLTIYLNGRSEPWQKDSSDPYGSLSSLGLLSDITIECIQKVGAKYMIVDYDYEDKGSFDMISKIVLEYIASAQRDIK